MNCDELYEPEVVSAIIAQIKKGSKNLETYLREKKKLPVFKLK